MNKTKWITIATALVWILVLVGWHLYDPSSEFTKHEPGADKRPAGNARSVDDVLIGEFFMKYEASEPDTTTCKASWNGFRGNGRDNICTDALQLATSGSSTFKEMWKVETGEGHAAPVIGHGRVYVMDYLEEMNADAIRCFNLKTGEELWRRWYRVPMKRNHGFSRTIPALYQDKVVTIGPEGHVMCCNALNGDMLWSMDMKKTFGTEIPFWYTGQCPLITADGTLVIAPSGNEILMAGIDTETGEVKWTTPNSVAFKMSHSSVMPMKLAGKQTLVYVGVGGVCGVSAEAEDMGTLLWSSTKWQPSVVAPSPLQLSDNQVFLVAGYGAGGALLQVDRVGGEWKAEIKDQYKANAGMSSEQQTPILYNGTVITILPKDGGGMRERLAMYTLSNLASAGNSSLHNPVWTSEADERFGLGPYVLIDGKLFAFKDDGELYVYQIEGKSMKLLHKQRVMEEGIDAWGPLAYADGYLLLRDSKTVMCLRVKDLSEDEK